VLHVLFVTTRVQAFRMLLCSEGRKADSARYAMKVSSIVFRTAARWGLMLLRSCFRAASAAARHAMCSRILRQCAHTVCRRATWRPHRHGRR
jgi:hypothetical protein